VRRFELRVRNRRLTIILVPQGGAKTYSFQARVGLLLAIAVLFVVLQLLSVTFMFSYGQLFAASRQRAKLEEQVAGLKRELTQIEELRRELTETEKTRQKVLAILSARGTVVDSFQTGEEAAVVASLDTDELLVRGEDFLRSVPRSWPVRGPVTKVYLAAEKDARTFHPGIDIAAATGTPVRAAAAGIVTFARWDPEYGNLVVLEHGLGLETRYGHNERLSVQVGDRVERGQLLAAVGSTGRSSAPHLHFEIRKDGAPIDPRQYLE
jgi:murein DD-endopeptidase MepM/ murein hydrolase activator NlpD